MDYGAGVTGEVSMDVFIPFSAMEIDQYWNPKPYIQATFIAILQVYRECLKLEITLIHLIVFT